MLPPRPRARTRVALTLCGVAAGLAVFVSAPRSSSATTADPTTVRYFVVLREPPLAQYRGGVAGLRPTALEAQPAAERQGAHLDTTTPAAKAYVAYLKDRQAAQIERVRAIAPEFARDDWTYQIVLNGFIAELTSEHAAAVAKLPEVLVVYPSQQLAPEMDGTMKFLGTEEAWAAAGGAEEAGAGARVAILEGGSVVDHPFFRAEGMPAAPAGFPQAKVYGRDGSVADIAQPERMVNGKNIGARVIVNQINQSNLGGYTTRASTHGMHTSGIATGRYGTYDFEGRQVTFSGVAPNAFLFHYYNLDDTPGYVKAFELMVEDEIDAVNMSLGQVMWLLDTGEYHPMALAQAAAAEAGVLTVASSGNAGSNGATSLSGGWKYSDNILVVGNTSSIGLSGTSLDVAGGDVPEELRSLTASPPRGTIAITTPIAGDLILADNGGCTPDPKYDGKVVVAERFNEQGAAIGSCDYASRAQNMLDSGALGIVYVYYNVYDPGASTTALVLPAVAIGAVEGMELTAWLRGGGSGTGTMNGEVTRRYSAKPDILDGSSSRGPGLDWSIKPDLSAPGGGIISSALADTDGDPNTAPAPAFVAMSGTSMAAPHVTGAAGLLRSIHPDWTVPELQSALINTTVRTVVAGPPQREQPVGPTDGGPGRLNLFDAPDPGAFLNPTKASFGEVEQGETKDVVIAMTSALDEPATWELEVVPGMGDAVVSVDPESLELAPGETQNFTVHLDASQATNNTTWGDIELRQLGAVGPITHSVYLPALANQEPEATGRMSVQAGLHQSDVVRRLHVAYYVHVDIPSERANVLLVDWTMGTTQDYSDFYTDALDAAGLTYTVWGIGEAGEHEVAHATHPPFAEMMRHDLVIINSNQSPISFQTMGAAYQYNNLVLAGGNLLIAGQGTPNWWRWLDYGTVLADTAANHQNYPDTWPRRWLGPSQNVGCEMCWMRYFAGFTPTYTATLSGKLLVPFPMQPSRPAQDVRLTRDASGGGGPMAYNLDISTGNKAKDGAAGNQYTFASGSVVEAYKPSGREQVTAEHGDVTYAMGVMDRYAGFAKPLWNYQMGTQTMSVGSYIAGKVDAEGEVPWNAMFWGFGLEGVGSAGAGTASRNQLMADTFNFLARNMVTQAQARWQGGAVHFEVDLGAQAVAVPLESAVVTWSDGRQERVALPGATTHISLAPRTDAAAGPATLTLHPAPGSAAPITLVVAVPEQGADPR